jgi:hypothetical protein
MINEMSWHQFSTLPGMSKIPQHEVERQYRIYLNEIAEQRIAIHLMQEAAMTQAEAMAAAASNGGGGFVTQNESEEEFPGGGTGAVTFNGSNQYFTALNSDVVNWLPGTGEFTIEFFIKKGVGGAGAPRVFSLGFDTSATIGISVEGGRVYVWPYGGSLNGTYPASYTAGNWMHVAICRDSAKDTRLYLDGVLKKTATGDTRDINDSINPGFDLNVGVDDPTSGMPNWWAGKLTNFRWDNSAIYTGASLTVPTAPLTKTPTTKLLMLGGGASNPVYDAAKLNNLVNNGSIWNSDTPFV